MDLNNIMIKAETSSFYRRILSIGLNRMVPFNKPHRFSVLEISEKVIVVKLPYIKRNKNHLKGLHACAMATLTEVSSGFLLISRLNPKKYRLILQRLDIEFLYQGKTDATARFEIKDEWWEQKILAPIQKDGLVNIACDVDVMDALGNVLTRGKAHWQIKDWQKVKSK